MRDAQRRFVAELIIAVLAYAVDHKRTAERVWNDMLPADRPSRLHFHADDALHRIALGRRRRHIGEDPESGAEYALE